MNTPTEIFVHENDKTSTYSISQGEKSEESVRYVREDLTPTEQEMFEFAKKMSFYLDDRLCPYDRVELRARAWLDGYYFAKTHKYRAVPQAEPQIGLGT